MENDEKISKKSKSLNSPKEDPMVNKGWNVVNIDNDYGPSKKMKYVDWQITSDESDKIPQLNKAYSSPQFMGNFYPKWKPIKQSHCESFSKPFNLAVLQNFIQNDEFIKNLEQEISTDIDWARKQMDLYEFYQSTDLANIDSPFLMIFYKFLKEVCLPWMKDLTQLELTNISASCSMYTAGDHLLVHDDLLSDRQIAFVYYISPWMDNWTEDMGGELEMFEVNSDNKPIFPVKRKINPANDQFVFFPVCDKSFHQVAEVRSVEYPRLTINGWFHGRKNEIFSKPVFQKFNSPLKVEMALEKYITKYYLNHAFKENIQKHIEEDSEASLEEFLKDDFYNSVLNELKNSNDFKLKWITKHPADQQHHDVLDLSSVPEKSVLQQILKLFTSESMLELLYEYTELDLYGENMGNPQCQFEFQRWKKGCYTVIGDKVSYDDSTLDLVLYFNAFEKVGVITYLAPEENQNEDDDPILLTIYPKNNSLNIVYRSEGTTKFTKYVSKNIAMIEDDFSYILTYAFRIYSTIAFIVVIIFIGLPMWWKTTEVYRVSLPYTEIDNLDKVPITAQLIIGLYCSSPDRQNLIRDELMKSYQDNSILDVKFEGLKLDVNKAFATPAALESALLLSNQNKKFNFLFIEWPKLTDDVLVTSDRSAFISSTTSSQKILQVLKTWIVKEHKLKSILGKITSVHGQQIRHNSAPPQPNYDVLLSVLNPRPDIQKVHWNVRLAAERYIEPFLKEISALSNFTVKSQWKYQVMFDHTSKQIKDDSKLGRHYALSEEYLPHIITSVEKKIGNEISKNPSIHIVVYIPSCQNGPLHIYNKNGERSSQNNVDSFISEKWGGIVIVNPTEANCLEYITTEEPIEIHVNSNYVMKIILYHLRKIFDIENNIPIVNAKMIDLETLEPRKWEIDTYLRTGTIHMIHSATSTIKSLIQLLGDISYIVINDDVGDSINNAYENILKAKASLKINDLESAVEFAKQAYQSAERAFFDQSLLALLYFPDEQKYAIYIPLFLPIMIPVVLSINSIRKYFKAKKQNSEDDGEKKDK